MVPAALQPHAQRSSIRSEDYGNICDVLENYLEGLIAWPWLGLAWMAERRDVQDSVKNSYAEHCAATQEVEDYEHDSENPNAPVPVEGNVSIWYGTHLPCTGMMAAQF